MKKMSLYFWGTCSVLFLIGLLIWAIHWHYIEYTNDAYVGGNQVYIVPLRPGFITAIHTDDTFLVFKDQLLVELDKTDSKIALAKAKVNLANAVRDICQAFHQVFVYRSEIEIRKAELIKAQEDFDHRYAVLSRRGVSLENYQHAVAALRANKAALEQTEALYKKAYAYVQGTSIQNHPLVQDAAQKVKYAWVQLYRCNIYAPVDGLVAQRKGQVGMWIKGSDPVMSVIPLDQMWLNANFKETQLKRVRIGQPVKVTSDYYGHGIVFHGTVVGLPGAAGNAFSLLPPENLSGNWIKIVQRLPVRVRLEEKELRKHPLRIGLSMEATVDLHDQKGLRVPTSNAGSPHYQTSIYEKEEAGTDELIDKIISENIDPSLMMYTESCFYLPDLEKVGDKTA